MKKLVITLIAFMVLGCGSSYAQFGGLGNKMLNKAKDKVEQKKNENKKDKKAKQASNEDNNSQNGANTSQSATNALIEHYNLLEESLIRLEEAIEANDMDFLFEAPEGNEAKTLINSSTGIAGFDANDPRYIELRDRYIADVRKYKGNLCSDQPSTKVKLNDNTASRQDRLDALYTLLDYYENKANEAQYYRQKEYYLSIAALCWKTIADAKLMQLNDAKLKGFEKRLNAIGRQLDYNNDANKGKSARGANGKLLLADQVDMVGPLPQFWFQIVDYTDNDYTGDANVNSNLQKQVEVPEDAPVADNRSADTSTGSNDVTKNPKFFNIKSDGTTSNGLSKWGKISGNDIYVYGSKVAVIIPTTRFASGMLEIKDLRSNLIVNALRPYGSGGWEVYDNNYTRKLGYVDGNGNVYKDGSFYCKMPNGTKPIWGAVIYLTKIFE